MRRALVIALILVVPFALLATACGSDSSSDASTETTATAPAAEGADVTAAVTAYRAYVTAQVADIVTTTKTFTDAVRAGDIPAAKAAYAPSRTAWESIEPIASLVPETDGSVDFRVDDFASVTDPKWTGWHRLEYLLWEKNTTTGAATYADQLDADLAKMQKGLAALDIPPLVMAQGASELIQEVSEGKITGEEDRYSKTDLYDFAANVDGAQRIVEGLTPALEAADPDLLNEPPDRLHRDQREPGRAAHERWWLRALLPGERRLPRQDPLPQDDRHAGPDRHDEGSAGEPVGGPGPCPRRARSQVTSIG